jgi:hypothetical protein
MFTFWFVACGLHRLVQVTDHSFAFAVTTIGRNIALSSIEFRLFIQRGLFLT